MRAVTDERRAERRHFALRLRLLMKRAGLTQQGLAEAIEVSRSAVAAWLGSIAEPSEPQLLDGRPLCAALKVPPDELLGMAPIAASIEEVAGLGIPIDEGELAAAGIHVDGASRKRGRRG